MLVQQQAFRLYYASMTDQELQAAAANRSSFIELAQQTLSEELARRNLTLPVPVAAETPHYGGFHAAIQRLLLRTKPAKAH